MNCSKCQTETSGDYPACTNCAPFMHFSHRTDCRCQDADCVAIATVRQAVANGEATERTKYDLRTYDQHNRIITNAQAEGLTVNRNIHTYRDSALADIRRFAAQNAQATTALPCGMVGRLCDGCASVGDNAYCEDMQSQNAPETVRWSNSQYVTEAKAAGGVLVIKTEVV